MLGIWPFSRNSLRATTLPLTGTLLLVATMCAGCHTAPDIRPFSTATTQLAASIKTSGRAVTGEIATMAESWPKDQQEEAAKISARFHEHWVKRDQLADALAAYSASLAEIVAAGDQGERSAQEVAATFKQLTDALNVLPAGGAAGTAADGVIKAGTFIYGMYARDKAARDLAAAMTNVQPYIDMTAQVLGHDLSDIESALARHLLTSRNGTGGVSQTKLPNGRLVSDERGDLEALRERQFTLQSQLTGTQGQRDAVRAAYAAIPAADLSAGGNVPPKIVELRADLDRWTVLTASIATEMESLAATIESKQTLLRPFDELIQAQNDRLAAEIQVVRLAKEGLASWADVHSQLAQAATLKHAPRTEDLVAIAEQLRELVSTLRQKKESK